jgi:omega-6 fatty acid desaturase (delta-12 desaturase)
LTGAVLEVGSATPAAKPAWGAIVSKYQHPEHMRAIWQVVTTLVPLAAVFWLMYLSYSVSYALTLLLAFPAGGLLVRTFIIMHDCGHGSFFKSRRANEIVGWFTGVMTLTPFAQWRKDHALHHASSGDLDRRGHGDIETITVKEYFAKSEKERKHYRFVRNPWVMLGLGPIYLMLSQRRMLKGTDVSDMHKFSVRSTNLAIIANIAGFTWWIGFANFMMVYFPAIYLAAAAGILLFYVQHQFEDTYWKDHAEWDYATAAIRGSSYFKLPAVLQWFTGSIGLHHVHHLGPRIPNYNLQRAHDENAMFHDVTVLTIRESLKTLRLRLWDEDQGRLVGFNESR